MKSKTAIRLALLSSILLTALLFPKIAELESEPPANLRFAISFPATNSKEPLDGRILLLLSTDNSKEPRFQISEDLDTQQVFGVDCRWIEAGP